MRGTVSEGLLVRCLHRYGVAEESGAERGRAPAIVAEGDVMCKFLPALLSCNYFVCEERRWIRSSNRQ